MTAMMNQGKLRRANQNVEKTDFYTRCFFFCLKYQLYNLGMKSLNLITKQNLLYDLLCSQELTYQFHKYMTYAM